MCCVDGLSRKPQAVTKKIGPAKFRLAEQGQHTLEKVLFRDRQRDRCPPKAKGHRFESCRVRHFGTELGTPKPAVFALSAATSVRRSTLFDPVMRSSFWSTSTRWANARRGSRR